MPGRGAVLVTGTSSGIGEATALRLASLGFEVFAGVRKEEDGERLRERAPERVRPVMVDVTEAESIGAARAQVEEAVGAGGLAGLVNNAGGAVTGPLEFLPIEDLRWQLELNTVAQVAVSQAFLPLLRRAPQARLVNIGSIGGRMATQFNGAYNASKYAMEGISDALRQELAPSGIHVALIEPGSIATEIWRKGLDNVDEEIGRIPPEGRTIYESRLRDVASAAGAIAARGIPPAKVADAVEHALTARRPRTRYLVGPDARVQAALAHVLPDRALDRVTGLSLRLLAREGRRRGP